MAEEKKHDQGGIPPKPCFFSLPYIYLFIHLVKKIIFNVNSRIKTQQVH